MKFDQLTLASINWLINRGYVKRTIEDGHTVLTLTTMGHVWLMQIEATSYASRR